MAVINRHALIDHFWRWEMLLHRQQNLMLLYHTFSQVQMKVLHVLLGINHVYFFGFKWLDVVEHRLSIAPAGLSEIVRHPEDARRQSAWAPMRVFRDTVFPPVRAARVDDAQRPAAVWQ